MGDTLPRISVLTPSFNQGRYIRQNIESVLAQGYPNTEHIVIDGGSTDDTLSILRRCPHLKWISEPDGGQADALNKGLALATGEIVGWINSDDWYEAGIFGEVARAFAPPGVEWALGDVTMVYEQANLLVRDSSPAVTYRALLRDPDIVRQPPVFFRRSALGAVSGWNAGFYMVMDYDLWLRLARRSSPVRVDSNWAYFRIHAAQKTTSRNYWRQYHEMDALLRRERAPASCRLRLAARRTANALKQRVKSGLIRIGVVDRMYEFRPVRVR